MLALISLDAVAQSSLDYMIPNAVFPICAELLRKAEATSPLWQLRTAVPPSLRTLVANALPDHLVLKLAGNPLARLLSPATGRSLYD